MYSHFRIDVQEQAIYQIDLGKLTGICTITLLYRNLPDKVEIFMIFSQIYFSALTSHSTSCVHV